MLNALLNTNFNNNGMCIQCVCYLKLVCTDFTFQYRLLQKQNVRTPPRLFNIRLYLRFVIDLVHACKERISNFEKGSGFKGGELDTCPYPLNVEACPPQDRRPDIRSRSRGMGSKFIMEHYCSYGAGFRIGQAGRMSRGLHNQGAFTYVLSPRIGILG